MAVSPSFLHSTGPIFIWAAIPTGTPLPTGTPQQLGTCEQWPVDSRQYSWEPVPNDLAGSMIPLDSQYMGQIESLSLEINRFNNDVIEVMAAAPSPGGDIPVPGYDGQLSRGLFLNQNVQGFQVWFQFSYFGTPAAPPDLPPGIYYPNCQFVSVGDPQQGTKYWKQHLEIVAFPYFIFTGGVWSFTVRSSDPSNFTILSGQTPS
jgi:hypothetical protein